MLTSDDLKQFRAIIREEIENESQAVKDELGSDIAMSKMTLSNDIQDLKDRIKNLEMRLTKVHKDLKEEIKMVVHFLYKENMKTAKRVKEIEEHIGLASS